MGFFITTHKFQQLLNFSCLLLLVFFSLTFKASAASELIPQATLLFKCQSNEKVDFFNDQIVLAVKSGMNGVRIEFSKMGNEEDVFSYRQVSLMKSETGMLLTNKYDLQLKIQNNSGHLTGKISGHYYQNLLLTCF